MLRLCSLLLLTAVACACQPVQAPLEVEPPPEIEPDDRPAWLAVASERDVESLEHLPLAWEAAMAEVRRVGVTRRAEAEGALLDPEGALDWPAPSPGAYRCRMIRIAQDAPRGRTLTAYPEHFCHVGAHGDRLYLTKETGTERPFGYLWPDSDPRRIIFLGALLSNDRDEPPPYGSEPESDVVGVFERVGSLRFRLVIPRLEEGILDVFEYRPAPIQPEE